MPDREKLALVVVDVLNDYEHPDAEQLMASVEETVPRIVSLVDAARKRDILTVYVNDDFQDWTLDRRTLVERVTDGPHRLLVEPLCPRDDVAFVLEGATRSSGRRPSTTCCARARSTASCSAGRRPSSASCTPRWTRTSREYAVTVARDACASIVPELAESALRLMEVDMHARIALGAEALEPEAA